MTDTVRIFCSEPGRIHGDTDPRRQWIDTFRRTGNSWQTSPPARSRIPSGDASEILHRTSEVAVTTEGFALGYAYRFTPLGPQRWRQTASLEAQDREIVKVPIDLRTGVEVQAELGHDYLIDHVTYEMRCPCDSKVDVGQPMLMQILDQVSNSGVLPELSLSLLRSSVQLLS